MLVFRGVHPGKLHFEPEKQHIGKGTNTCKPTLFWVPAVSFWGCMFGASLTEPQFGFDWICKDW